MLFELVRTPAGDRLFLHHFGARVADTAGALALAGHGGHQSALGSEKPLAYSVFGESGGELNRFGGLKVTHDDGSYDEVRDTLAFRNRIRDGINEWQDENPGHYKK